MLKNRRTEEHLGRWHCGEQAAIHAGSKDGFFVGAPII
jgi:hypothetical protein